MRRHPDQQTVNPRTGRIESVFVNLEAVYPNPEDPEAEEFCFEELRAQHRGWFDVDWKAPAKPKTQKMEVFKEEKVPLKEPESESQDIAEGISNQFRESFMINDENAPPSQQDAGAAAAARKMRKEMRKEERANRTRKIRVMEVKGQTQTGAYRELQRP
jgi:checkpoint serine/threonine-protein kinase